MNVLPTGKIAENLYAVSIKDMVNFYIYKKGGNVLCFDCGMGTDRIKAEMAKINISPEEVSLLFLTHSDHDHVGGIPVLVNAKVYLSEDEEQMVNGTTKRGLGILRNPKIPEPYTLLGDGETLSAGETTIKAISVPGHTPGSMAYLVDGVYLIAGDTIILRNGKVTDKGHRFSMDKKQQKSAFKKLALLEGVKIICTGHTGMAQNYEEAFAAWK